MTKNSLCNLNLAIFLLMPIAISVSEHSSESKFAVQTYTPIALYDLIVATDHATSIIVAAEMIMDKHMALPVPVCQNLITPNKLDMGLKRSISSVFIILFLILGEGLPRSSAFLIHNNERVSCNGTFTNCLFDNDEYGGGEFLMPYPVAGGGRWLLQKQNSISYSALKTKPICNNDKYGNCIQVNGQKNSRPCTYYNRCKHG